MTPESQFAWSSRDGAAVVHASGELDLGNADALRSCCQEALADGGPRLVVDLSDVTFLDSTALGVFVRVSKRARQNGGWLRLVTGPSRPVQRVLEITALVGVLGNYSSVEAAING